MASGIVLHTIGHGTAPLAEFVAVLARFQIASIVDVRRFAGSRRNPQFGAQALERSLGEAGIAYRHESALGGRRKARPDSRNVALRNEAFRAYADYMETPEFTGAFDALAGETEARVTAIMCAETLWWRCHRRLISDRAMLLDGAHVLHIINGVAKPHVPTQGVRPDGRFLVYDLCP